MSLTEESKVGAIIGKLSTNQDEIKQNLSPDQANAQEQFFMTEPVIIRGIMTANALIYSNTSFILDHPVYGELDSAVLKLDGGYDEGVLVMPVTMPITFMTATQQLDYQEF